MTNFDFIKHERPRMLVATQPPHTNANISNSKLTIDGLAGSACRHPIPSNADCTSSGSLGKSNSSFMFRRCFLLNFYFPIEEFSDPDIAMYCKTEDEANEFLHFLHSIGRKWSSGSSYISENNFHSYEDICYYFNKGCYGDYHRALRLGRTVLKFSDFYFCQEADLETDERCLDEFFLSFSVIR